MRRTLLAIAVAIAAVGVIGRPSAANAAPPSIAQACGAAAATGPFVPAPPVVTYGAARALAPGVTARDVRFASPTGHVVTGEIVAGAAAGSQPGVLFVHWLGEPKTTNHTEFEADAVALARRGATSLLVDAMWAAPDWFDTIGKSADADYRATADQVDDLRRALDVLSVQPGVDPGRIAYVGHDFGAMVGALVACADARPNWFVLMAGTRTLSEWYLLGKTATDGYAARIDADLDLLGPLSRSRAKGFLFQFSAHDHYIPADRALAFLAAAPLPKGAFWYDTDHALAIPAAFADRQAWLADKLFGGP